MIKVDACALKPVVTKMGNVARNVAKVAAIALPAAIVADEFISEGTQKVVDKDRCGLCSDYCCEVL